MLTRRLIIIHGDGGNCIELSLMHELAGAGWQVLVARSAAHAQEMIVEQEVTAGLVCLEGTAGPGPELEDIILANSSVEWIALTTHRALQQPDVRRMIGELFHDYHTSPPDHGRLLIALGHAHGKAMLKKQWLSQGINLSQHQMIGSCGAMRQLFDRLKRMGATNAPVLITGESGTGKELAAHAIHQHSDRANNPFVAVNCAALPTHLIHSELFGHEKGAFTGAHQRKIGRIETAAGGTIFLDEIGDLPLELQVHLLRFLQNNIIERLGSASPTHVDVRVIAATNIDLEKAVEEGRFREDLYYRINVLRVKIPALRERENDVDLLARAYFEKFSKENRSKAKGFSQRAIFAMRAYHWPGNIRELINRVRSAIIMSDGRLISAADLGLENPLITQSENKLNHARNQTEHELIRNTLRYNGNNVSQSAKQLGISRATLYRLINKFPEAQTC
jgi:DNA-binding NtrC family response regulator